MSLGLSLIHLLNFLAPALFLAVILSLFEIFQRKKSILTLDFTWCIAIYFLISASVLVVGILSLGRDGKMATYATLVILLAFCYAWRTRP